MNDVMRVRFHGRGGQGMKTASRILGSAAFHAGREVQDSPVYGAERRGAPMMAFTRIASEPIFERGAIERPHLVVVADDTLVGDPAASPLAGCDRQATLLLNSARELELGEHAGAGRILRYDLTALALRLTETVVSLSTALGVAACRLVGLSLDDALQGVEDELSHALGGERLERNRGLAREVYRLGEGWAPISLPEQESRPDSQVRLFEPTLDSPLRSTPNVVAPANTPERHTGNWRQFRPVLEKGDCNRCWLCFVWCPEAAITLDENEYPMVEYDVCKGCLLCAHECPTHAFRIEREVRA